MPDDDPEFFGSDAHVAMQSTVLRMGPLLRGSAGFCTAGRCIIVDDYGRLESDELLGLVAEFGMIAVFFLRARDEPQLRNNIEAQGFTIGLWDGFESNASTYPRSAAIAETALPDGYSLVEIDRTSPAGPVRGFQTLLDSCEMAPLPGYVLRGRAHRAVTLALENASGEIVTTGCALEMHNPDGKRARHVWTGLLAVREDERGRGLGKLILARTIAEAYRRLKPVTVYASARAANPASQAVCQACGLFPTDWYVGAIQNPAVFSESFTR